MKIKNLIALADALDACGLYKDASKVDNIIKKVAQGRSLSDWKKALKSQKASAKIIRTFEKQWKGALEFAKKKKKLDIADAEEYAVRTAISRLPSKYKKHKSKKKSPKVTKK